MGKDDDIGAILLKPALAHRKTLIGEGACRSRAPLAVCLYGRWHEGAVGFTSSAWWENGALAMAWNDRPVPEGVFRAWNVWGPDEDAVEFEATGWSTYDVLAQALDNVNDTLWLAESLQRSGVGQVFVLPRRPAVGSHGCPVVGVRQ